jgi:hypothetical protein
VQRLADKVANLQDSQMRASLDGSNGGVTRADIEELYADMQLIHRGRWVAAAGVGLLSSRTLELQCWQWRALLQALQQDTADGSVNSKGAAFAANSMAVTQHEQHAVHAAVVAVIEAKPACCYYCCLSCKQVVAGVPRS